MKNNHGFIHIVLILVIVLTGITGIGYLAYKNDQIQPLIDNPLDKKTSSSNSPPISPTPAIQQVDTTNWKTYTNTQYGYSFKYPSEFKILGVEYGMGLTDINPESTGVNLDNSNLSIWVYAETLTKNFISQEKQKGMIQSKIVINNIETIVFESEKSKDYLLPIPNSDRTVIVTTSKNFDKILSTFKFLD